jgi:hypothetical protein
VSGYDKSSWRDVYISPFLLAYRLLSITVDWYFFSISIATRARTVLHRRQAGQLRAGESWAEKRSGRGRHGRATRPVWEIGWRSERGRVWLQHGGQWQNLVRSPHSRHSTSRVNWHFSY